MPSENSRLRGFSYIQKGRGGEQSKLPVISMEKFISVVAENRGF